MIKKPCHENVFIGFCEQDRSTKGKLSKEQMISIYKDMSDLDSTRISDVVDSLAKVFDEDHSGTVGKQSIVLTYFFIKILSNRYQ